MYNCIEDRRPTDQPRIFSNGDGYLCIQFAFGSRLGFSGRRIEWSYFRLDQIQDDGRPPSGKFCNGHISATGHPIHFMFGSRVEI